MWVDIQGAQAQTLLLYIVLEGAVEMERSPTVDRETFDYRKFSSGKFSATFIFVGRAN